MMDMYYIYDIKKYIAGYIRAIIFFIKITK